MTPAQLAMIERRIHDLRGATSPAQVGERDALRRYMEYSLLSVEVFAEEAHTHARVSAFMGAWRSVAYWSARRDTWLMLDAMVVR